MTAGLSARLDRISTNDRYLIVPMDHGITMGAVEGLVDIESTIDGVTSGGADAVLTQRGIAERVHPNKNDAGYIVHLNGSTTIGPDESDKRVTGTAADAVRAGADAVSFHINVGSEYEPNQIEDLAELTADAERLGLPVLAMAYARGPGVDESDPEALGHAVRLAEELGADVVKTGYSGDGDSFARVTESTRLPVVIAGGSKGTDRETVEMVRGAMDGAAAGVSMGRSIFQHDDPEGIARAVSAVVHDDAGVDEALRAGGFVEA
ncbi:2-amino-3,7-dideoxy-D-threo-hept-6-ulosonate synthase [Halorubrum ezzemoulense]|jgi:fructose-bisphosphate aldolase/2-amino-3,7-dideoxy-D-threo-hept-6-ulosonate synthase|uniref:2-amino-3,7-dideoxy-D-threo-hept-6-ulosonate synthase n=3 Tax=Halorubrum ezzemoulense TaxID=337243 RepID=A0A256KS97_HALEZ|nr:MULTISPECIES: 2-amino-3,7-dideoxy-D-threo-hept-6-ulosonate synthase [Halorubrum]MDB2224945.1 2-amino-3,7-dideoxy-D-threo-hept-6-ulosonate synthase [Halorubrum ezzemoulense]MDB2237180.1 2-amino-3,7-dideoxy-D-threo-hept-6-ulosonate synthase [Halorubrum ezzemoulense]MDB2241657.1 2-amino-3,7-dideoxy-D-threo-hept-6-ulosonate synthase [Halorubrum ezzemoulense]MDB2245522.1 2-amino-3,7-dideoxy-D-threo-hept-6-ulosonate synthase [Halorubrum ezzemoulense]MDB2246870.1 2-amino-3,7-dideoxy-D-threo-hept-6